MSSACLFGASRPPPSSGFVVPGAAAGPRDVEGPGGGGVPASSREAESERSATDGPFRGRGGGRGLGMNKARTRRVPVFFDSWNFSIGSCPFSLRSR